MVASSVTSRNPSTSQKSSFILWQTGVTKIQNDAFVFFLLIDSRNVLFFTWACFYSSVPGFACRTRFSAEREESASRYGRLDDHVCKRCPARWGICSLFSLYILKMEKKMSHWNIFHSHNSAHFLLQYSFLIFARKVPALLCFFVWIFLIWNIFFSWENCEQCSRNPKKLLIFVLVTLSFCWQAFLLTFCWNFLFFQKSTFCEKILKK